MMNIARMSDEGNAVLHQRARETFAQWVTFLSQIVEDGKQAGQLQNSLDGKAFATLAISLLEGAYLTSTLQSSKNARQIAEEHLNTYLDGFLVQDGEGSRSRKSRLPRKRAKA